MGLVLTNEKGEIQTASLSEEEKVEEAAFNSQKEDAKSEESKPAESETKEAEAEPEAEAEEEAEVELVEDEQNEESEEEEDTEEEGEEPESKVTTVPIWRVKKIEKRLKNELASQFEGTIAELKKANADLQAKLQAGELSSSKDIEEFAAKHQLDKGFISELSQLLLSRVPKGNPALEEQVKELQETKKELERQAIINRQYTGYEQDFEENVLPLLEEDKATPERINDVKLKLRNLALHNPKFTATPLDVMYYSLDKIAPSTQRKTAESSKTSVSGETNFVDFDSMTAEQIASLSSEDFAKYDKYMMGKDDAKRGVVRLQR